MGFPEKVPPTPKCRLPWWLSGKESTCNVGDVGLIPWVGKIPWRRKRQPTPVFLPGESHGQRRLVGYSPWGRKESEPTERLTLALFTPDRCIVQVLCAHQLGKSGSLSITAKW